MRNRFFHVDKSSDTKVIGSNYPQCSGVLKTYNNNSEISLTKFAYFKGNKVDFVPDLDGITLYKSSKLTDFISCSLGPGNDSVIGLTFFDLLSNHKLSDIQFFNCFLYKADEKYYYIWLHYIYSLEEFVDYKKSVFTHPDED